MILKDEILNYIDALDAKTITKNSYQQILNRFEKYMSKKGISTPTRSDILKYKQYMIDNLHSSSTQKAIVVLRGFYKYLKMTGKHDDIMYGIKGLKVSTFYKRHALSLEDAQRLLDYAKRDIDTLKGMRNYCIVLLLLMCGLRTIEVERADIDDLQLVEGRHLLYTLSKGKDDKSDFVKVSDEVFNELMKYFEMRGYDSINENPAMFLKIGGVYDGKRIKANDVSRIVKKMFRYLGFEGRSYTAHSLRHTHANLLLNAGATLEETKTSLRHKHISTTEIYAHMRDTMRKDTARMITDALFDRKDDKDNDK
jgi:site-specific recombinase XerD